MSDFAASFVRRFPHLTGYVDGDDVNAQAEALGKAGLDSLNQKALAAPVGGVLDVVTEHNTAALLVRRGFVDLQHEPPSMAKPVDLVGVCDGRTYRVEVKRLAASAHDGLHARTMQALDTALKSDTQSIMIEMRLHEPFKAAHTNALVRHVKQALREPRMDEVHTFAVGDKLVASYRLHPASKSYPHVGILGDYLGAMHDVTGVDASRIKGKVKLAYDKFKTAPADEAVHLVVIEVDSTVSLAHVADALYGQECVFFDREGPDGQGRMPGGMFAGGRHSRLGGLVIARRTEPYRLFSSYAFALFTNPGGALPVSDAVQALGVGQTFGPHDFPAH